MTICSQRGILSQQEDRQTEHFDGKIITYSNEKEYKFKSLRELGKANIYGFVLEEVWDSLSDSDYSIRPDFDSEDFDMIFEGYEKARKKKGH